MKNIISLHVCHYKPNEDRYAYLSNVLDVLKTKIEWHCNFDAEEIAEKISNVYRFDINEWNVYIDKIKHILLTNSMICNLSETERAISTYDMYRNKLSDCMENANPEWLHARSLNVKEISLFLKHFNAWVAIANGNSMFGLVLEDDVVLKADSLKYLEYVIGNIPQDCKYLDLAGGANLAPFADHIRTDGCFYKITPPMTRTTCAYIINKQLCADLISNTLSIVLPVDWQLMHYFNTNCTNVYWLEPKMFIHGSEEGKYVSNMR